MKNKNGKLDKYEIGSVVVLSEYGSKRKFKIEKCRYCGNKFAARIYKNYVAEFCSQKCNNSSRSNKIKVKCDFCGKIIFRQPSEISRSEFNFCSRKCKENAMRTDSDDKFLKMKPTHYNTGNGTVAYRRKAFNYYQNECSACGYKEHSEVLDVHHIDSNRENNAIDNLIILCPNCHAGITRGYATLKDRKLIWI